MNQVRKPAVHLARERGIALVVVLSMVVLLTLVVSFAITVSNRDGTQAGKRIHNLTVQNVTESALQYSRSFFSVNYLLWHKYLGLTYPPVQGTNPELFPVVPSGYSCYIYARDDADEIPPAIPDPTTDNNHLIYVGASCTGPQNTSAELSAPLLWDASRTGYTAQGSGGTHGINNYRGATNVVIR